MRSLWGTLGSAALLWLGCDGGDGGSSRSDAAVGPERADATVVDAAVEPDAAAADAMPIEAGSCALTSGTTFTATPAADITVDVPVASTLVVAGAPAALWSIRVTTNITHTFNEDLDVSVTSPAGTVVAISTGNGGSNDDVLDGTIWADDAATPVTDFGFIDGIAATTLIPEAAFARLRGENPNGTWTLNVIDDVGGDNGVLASWTLELITVDAAPTEGIPTVVASSAVVAIGDALPPVAETIAINGFVGTVCDVEVITNVTHTFASDLDMTVTSPGGSQVVLTTGNGGGSDDVFDGTTWDDAAAEPATDFLYTDGVTAPELVPEGRFAALEGENPNGTWTLGIVDSVGGDDGSLAGWQVMVSACTCP
jgi:subtilisin-like proprotein convertase family protein